MLSRAADSISGAAGVRDWLEPRWATVRVETDSCVYVGRVPVPNRRHVAAAVAESGFFVYLTEVRVAGRSTTEPFVAINRNYIKTLRVLDDGSPCGHRGSRATRPAA